MTFMISPPYVYLLSIYMNLLPPFRYATNCSSRYDNLTEVTVHGLTVDVHTVAIPILGSFRDAVRHNWQSLALFPSCRYLSLSQLLLPSLLSYLYSFNEETLYTYDASGTRAHPGCPKFVCQSLLSDVFISIFVHITVFEQSSCQRNEMEFAPA
jgi:hypothetical protein